MTQRSPLNPDGFEASLIRRLFKSMGLIQQPKRGTSAKAFCSTEFLESRELLSASGNHSEALSYNFPVDVNPPHDMAEIIPLTTVDVQDQNFSIIENAAIGTVVGTVAGTDPDPGTPLTWTISAGNTNSAFAIDPNSGKITVSNPAALNFEVTPAFTLTVTATDSTTPETSDSATVTISLTNLNEPTSISLQSTATTYVIGSDPVPIDPLAVLIPDPETPSASYKNAKLTVSLGRERPSDKDVLRILNGGYGPGEIHVGKTQILYEGHLIGTYSGGRGTTPDLMIRFYSTATPEAVQALLRQIAFNTKSHIEVPPDRIVNFRLTNVDGQNAPIVSRVVHVTRVV